LFQREDFRNLRELILGEIPVVAVGGFFASCRCVLPGYEKGIRSLVSEIYRRGHRRIAFLFRDGLAERGICRKAICAALKEHHLEVPEYFFRTAGSGTAQEAFAETMKLLQKNKWLHPTCILFTDEMLLEGGAAAIHQCGFRIPEDICVAAVRISEDREYRDFPVTSWRIPPSRIAEEAVGLMLDGISRAGQGMGRIRLIDGILYGSE
jgi:LacI family transcriptional regulator/LacI family purine nucleotide synthesis repressor